MEKNVFLWKADTNKVPKDANKRDSFLSYLWHKTVPSLKFGAFMFDSFVGH